jgi:hypothetical protein
MHHEEEDPAGPKPRADRVFTVPDWMKFAVAVIAGTIAAMVWMQANFVSRVEFSSHAAQKEKDLARIADLQEHYATAERKTAENLAEIRADVGWLRAYLDMSMPPPSKNGRPK